MYYFQVIVGLLGAFAMRTIQVFPWDDQCPLELSQCPLGQSSVPWDSQVSLGTVKCPLGQSSVPWDSQVSLGTVRCPLGQSSVPWDSQVSLGTVKCPLVQSDVPCDAQLSHGTITMEPIQRSSPLLMGSQGWQKAISHGCPMWPHAEVVSIVHWWAHRGLYPNSDGRMIIVNMGGPRKK